MTVLCPLSSRYLFGGVDLSARLSHQGPRLRLSHEEEPMDEVAKLRIARSEMFPLRLRELLREGKPAFGETDTLVTLADPEADRFETCADRHGGHPEWAG